MVSLNPAIATALAINVITVNINARASKLDYGITT